MTDNTNISKEKEQRRGRFAAIMAQTSGVHGVLAFKNSLLLLYMLSMGLSEARVLVYLSIFGICNFMGIPAAYFSDKIGQKRIGFAGLAMNILGFSLIACAGFAPTLFTKEVIVLTGIVIFSFGESLFSASWYPLVHPIVPEKIRGRFWGKLRITFQVAGLLFSGLAAWIIGAQGRESSYQLIMAMIAVLLIGRGIFYRRIPEYKKNAPEKEPFLSTLGRIIRLDCYASFGAYIFLLMIFTANTPIIFALIEKEVMMLKAETVVWLANIGLFGCLGGFYVGGHAVDRLGTKPVFLICHFGFAVFSILFIFRDISPVLTMPLLGICNFAFGFIFSGSSIAITTEMFALMPTHNRALAMSIFNTMLFVGTGLSGIICAGILNFNFLKKEWLFCGLTMSNYDAILLGCGGMVLLLTATLGLVPSIIQKK
ncbi:MAG: hypothetical protein DRQ57_16335 [Gammaproteobacteria bacterium]|nr:MAG: hypothetical protein DRQ57_16335 [Gammaproteobacteria bacterium]